MATRTIANGGGNWSSTSTWVEGAVPTASDDVTATTTSGQLTIDVNNAICSTFTITSYRSVLTVSSGSILQVNGTFYLGINMSNVAGTGIIRFGTTTSAIRSYDRVIGCSVEFTGGTKTIGFYNMVVTGDLRLAGHTTLNALTLTFGGSIVSVTDVNNYASQSIGGSSPLVMNGTGSVGNVTIKSNLTINTSGTITFTASATLYWQYLAAARTFTYTAGTIVVGSGHNLYLSNYSLNVNTTTINWQNVFVTPDTGTAGDATIRLTGNFLCEALTIYDSSTQRVNLSIDNTKTLTINTSITGYSFGYMSSSPVIKATSGTAILYYKGTFTNMNISNLVFTSLNSTNRTYSFGGSQTSSNVFILRTYDFLDAGISITHL